MNLAELNFLVVEDHEFQRNMALRILANLGATKVVWAADGRAALDIVNAKDTPIHIIISDLNMPGMDGMEFMRHLGELGLPVSIILASGLEGALLGLGRNHEPSLWCHDPGRHRKAGHAVKSGRIDQALSAAPSKP